MKIIIDTHIFLWALAEPQKLSDANRSELVDLSNTIYVSAISITEIMIKTSIGKFHVNFNPVEKAEESGFKLLAYNAEAALVLKDMPFHHKDPFDRMLIAQSMALNYPIMTEDPKFSLYNCRIL
jgi:PIN domain nuclease of toxin-antitoxin system